MREETLTLPVELLDLYESLEPDGRSPVQEQIELQATPRDLPEHVVLFLGSLDTVIARSRSTSRGRQQSRSRSSEEAPKPVDELDDFVERLTKRRSLPSGPEEDNAPVTARLKSFFRDLEERVGRARSTSTGRPPSPPLEPLEDGLPEHVALYLGDLEERRRSQQRSRSTGSSLASEGRARLPRRRPATPSLSARHAAGAPVHHFVPREGSLEPSLPQHLTQALCSNSQGLEAPLAAPRWPKPVLDLARESSRCSSELSLSNSWGGEAHLDVPGLPKPGLGFARESRSRSLDPSQHRTPAMRSPFVGSKDLALPEEGPRMPARFPHLVPHMPHRRSGSPALWHETLRPHS